MRQARDRSGDAARSVRGRSRSRRRHAVAAVATSELKHGFAALPMLSGTAGSSERSSDQPLGGRSAPYALDPRVAPDEPRNRLVGPSPRRPVLRESTGPTGVFARSSTTSLSGPTPGGTPR